MSKQGAALKKAGGHIVTGKVKEVQNVSDDQNWKAYVAREVKSVEVWKEDWGFLVKGRNV